MRFLLAISLLCLTACGYRFEDETVMPRTVSVPVIEGDWDGELTSQVVQLLAGSGVYTYKREGGAAVLKIKIIDYRDENIGFRYYRNKEGDLKKDLVPTETRITASAEVSLMDAASCTPLLGPVQLTAWVDFDHDFYASANIFSLGQLNDYDSAYDAVGRPLNKALATKIVDFVNDGW